MRIIKYPENYEYKTNEICCFLAGGCTDTQWREELYNYFNNVSCNHLVLIDPYNPNIINKEEQIKWEFNHLNNFLDKGFIFSIYFDKYTDQPISMYELGRASALCKPQSIEIVKRGSLTTTTSVNLNYGFPMIVSIHPEAPKRDEILIQCNLVNVLAIVRDYEQHAKAIRTQYNEIKYMLK